MYFTGFVRDEPWKKVKFLCTSRLQTGTPSPLYDGPLEVNAAKLDLQDTASEFVPEPQHQFDIKMTAPLLKKKGSDNEA